ncbi:MAG: hypothetical protein LBU36_02155 [Clostridiales bacterium]|jgi:hypothetical protein|nr:hypothetical protein [Clostridiales bacterium]
MINRKRLLKTTASLAMAVQLSLAPVGALAFADETAPAVEQPGEGTTAGEQPGEGAQTGEQPGEGTTAGEQPGEGTQTGEQPGEGTTAGEQPGDAIPIGGQPGEALPIGGQPPVAPLSQSGIMPYALATDFVINFETRKITIPSCTLGTGDDKYTLKVGTTVVDDVTTGSAIDIPGADASKNWFGQTLTLTSNDDPTDKKTIKIPALPSKPAPKADYATGFLTGLAAGTEYKIEFGSYQDSPSAAKLSLAEAALFDKTVTVRKKATDKAFASDEVSVDIAESVESSDVLEAVSFNPQTELLSAPASLEYRTRTLPSGAWSAWKAGAAAGVSLTSQITAGSAESGLQVETRVKATTSAPASTKSKYFNIGRRFSTPGASDVTYDFLTEKVKNEASGNQNGNLLEYRVGTTGGWEQLEKNQTFVTDGNAAYALNVRVPASDIGDLTGTILTATATPSVTADGTLDRAASLTYAKSIAARASAPAVTYTATTDKFGGWTAANITKGYEFQAVAAGANPNYEVAWTTISVSTATDLIAATDAMHGKDVYIRVKGNSTTRPSAAKKLYVLAQDGDVAENQVTYDARTEKISGLIATATDTAMVTEYRFYVPSSASTTESAVIAEDDLQLTTALATGAKPRTAWTATAAAAQTGGLSVTTQLNAAVNDGDGYTWFVYRTKATATHAAGALHAIKIGPRAEKPAVTINADPSKFNLTYDGATGTDALTVKWATAYNATTWNSLPALTWKSADPAHYEGAVPIEWRTGKPVYFRVEGTAAVPASATPTTTAAASYAPIFPALAAAPTAAQFPRVNGQFTTTLTAYKLEPTTGEYSIEFAKAAADKTAVTVEADAALDWDAADEDGDEGTEQFPLNMDFDYNQDSAAYWFRKTNFGEVPSKGLRVLVTRPAAPAKPGFNANTNQITGVTANIEYATQANAEANTWTACTGTVVNDLTGLSGTLYFRTKAAGTNPASKTVAFTIPVVDEEDDANTMKKPTLGNESEGVAATVVIDYVNETINKAVTADSSAVLQYKNGSTWRSVEATGLSLTALLDAGTDKVDLRFTKGSGVNQVFTSAVELEFGTRPAAPSFTDSGIDFAKEKYTAITAANEYRVGSAGTWLAGAEAGADDVGKIALTPYLSNATTAQTLNIRAKATASAFAGEAVGVEIPARPAAPTVAKVYNFTDTSDSGTKKVRFTTPNVKVYSTNTGPAEVDDTTGLIMKDGAATAIMPLSVYNPDSAPLNPTILRVTLAPTSAAFESKETVVTLLAKGPAPTVTFDEATALFTGLSYTLEFKSADTDAYPSSTLVWAACNGEEGRDATPLVNSANAGKYFFFRTVLMADKPASAYNLSGVQITALPAPTGLAWNATDKKITGLTADMEYSLNGVTWKAAVADEVFAWLQPAADGDPIVLNIRTKTGVGSPTAPFASLSTTVEIPAVS